MTPEAAGMYRQPRAPLGPRRENEVYLIQPGPTIALRDRLNRDSKGTIYGGQWLAMQQSRSDR